MSEKKRGKARIRALLDSSGHDAGVRAARQEGALPPPTVPHGRLIQFFRCLAVMVTAGMPVHQALAFLAEVEEAPLGPVLASVVTQIEQGSNFSRSLAAFPKVFPAMAIHMVEIGESSGRMAFCLNELADYLEKNQALRRRMVSALAYPCMLIVLTLFMTAVMLFFVFPKQQETFARLDADLPLLTRLLAGCLPILSSPLFVGATLGVGLALFLGRAPLAWYWKHHLRAPFDRRVLTVPVLGPLLNKAGTSQILNAMSTLLEAGCSLEQTTRAAELGLNLELRRRYLRFLEALQDGARLDEAVARSRCFPATIQHVFAVAQEHGSLGTLARRCAALYQEEVDWAFLSFASLAEPLALAFMGLVMGTVMLATFLPMVSLMQKL